MADALINCPSCGFQLGVPPNLMGQQVQCPRCSAAFVAMLGGPGRADDYGEPRRRRPAVSTTGAAVFWIVASLAGVGIGAILLFQGLALQANPAPLVKVFTDAAAQQPDPEAKQMAQDLAANPTPVTTGVIGYGGAIVGVNLLGLLGGVLLAAKRAYWLVMLAAIVGLLNVVNCCTLDLGLFASIWALVTLARDDVRAAFQ